MRIRKRARRIAKLLALSLILSGLPMMPADAVEILEHEGAAVQEETGVRGESISVPETNAKMAGSDGVFYDDVLYLSARNVMAMDERLQERYRRLCDEIAVAKNDGVEVENVVFAVDADGRLHCSYSASMRGLDVMMAGAPSEPDENDETSLDEGEGAVEENDGMNAEEDSTEESGGTNPAEEGAEKNDEANPAEEGTEKNDVTNSDDEEKDAEENDEMNPDEGEDIGKDDETNPDGEDVEENEDTISVDEEEAAKKSVGILNEENEEDFVVFEENMEKLSKFEAETFNVIEPVRLTDMVDLGYGEFGESGIQVYSLLPSEDYYRDQLTDIQKKIYDEAKDTFLKGTNQFTVATDDSSEVGWDDVTHAVNALMLAYPSETDWMGQEPERIYGFNGDYFESDDGVWHEVTTFTFKVSTYYSDSLELQAQEKVREVGQLAIQYAVENYPDVLTYGVVKYLDQWVCENGYFTEKGGPEFFGIPNPDYEQSKLFYNCHTAYGILLEGYGVCESYAKTMSRLLDAVGIPNLLVYGDWKTYGHVWNYVQMPNGNWYMVDSTYDDESGPPAHKMSNRKYLLVKNDRKYVPDGIILYEQEETKFTFPTLADSSYDPENEYDSDSDYGNGNGTITLNKTECSLLPKGKETLTYTIDGDWDYSKTTGIWSSSDTKVAKVDKNGVVTAVAPGTATVFLTASGMAAECKIHVDQVKAVRSESTGKTNESVSLGIDGENKDIKTIALTVDMGKSPHTAEWMIQQGKVAAPQTVCSKQIVAVTDVSVAENRITLALQAISSGNANVSVKFAGKTVTLKVAIGQLITEKMFDITWPAAVSQEGENRTTPYTGKAIKPVVKKKTDAQYKPVTFKTTYVHNKDAGTAKVLVTGTGKYAGTIEYPFVITPIDITDADFSKALKSKAYTGGANPPTTVVKLNGKVLKADRDYEILYNNEKESEIRDENGGAIPVGSYTITINGKGNYVGMVDQTQLYTVTPNTIARVSVVGVGSAKYTGIEMKPYTVKIGKNILPDTDYKITWYRGQGKKRNATPMKTAPTAKGKFTAVITVEGSNLTVTNKKKEIVKNFTIK